MANHNRKVTDDQRRELIDIYLATGMKGVAVKAAEYGVSAKYVANAASFDGIKRNRQGLYLRDQHDPRWARAQAIGAVIA